MAPSDLDATSRRLWQRVMRDLERRGVMQEVDVDAVERYVRTVEVGRQALARVRARAKLEGDEAAWSQQITHGGRGVHADVRIWREAQRDAASFAHDLGLTPRARAALREQPATGDDPFAVFLGGASS